MLSTQQLASRRGGKILFRELDLQLDKGRILLIKGNNGSGKTTLLRILCGLLTPCRGQVYWQQQPISHCRDQYHQQLFYAGHLPGVMEELTVQENLHYNTRLAGGHASHTSDALESVGLLSYRDTLCRHLSAGQHRRARLAGLWLTSATLWILDEPFTALDTGSRQQLENRLQRHCRNDGMVILTSHQSFDLPDQHIDTITL